MFNETAPVTGSISNIVAALRAMFAAGLLRVEHIKQNGYETVRVIVGDDSEVRAYYGRMVEERKAMEAHAVEVAKAGNQALAGVIWQQASELLCRYQERSYGVSERPFSLSTNIYGWCVGSMLLSNLGGGRFAWSNRGDTLEQCIDFGCSLARSKGTTLTFDLDLLPMSPEERGALASDFGAEQSAIDYGLAWAARQAAKAQAEIERQERCAKAQAESAQLRAAEEAFRPARARVLGDVYDALAPDGARVVLDGTGCTVRGTDFNPSFRLTVERHGWKIVRTDFDGVRKEHSNVAFSADVENVSDIVTAARDAWTAMKPIARKGRGRFTSKRAS